MNNILIFGDSYSTFRGFIPDGYATYYPKDGFDVSTVSDTWWQRVIDEIGGKLLLNNSWSGSTIGYTGYGGADCSKTSSFIYRLRCLIEEDFFEKNEVNTIFVFGGTNDSWSSAPLGEKICGDIKEEDLFLVIPAIRYFLESVKAAAPFAKIVTIINTDINDKIKDTIKFYSEELGITYVTLADICKKDGHPTALGMQEIAKQVITKIN